MIGFWWVSGMRESSPPQRCPLFPVVVESCGWYWGSRGRQGGVGLEEQVFVRAGIGQLGEGWGELDASHGVDDFGAELQKFQADGIGDGLGQRRLFQGDASDILVQSRRNKKAALKMTRGLLKKPSYGAALKDCRAPGRLPGTMILVAGRTTEPRILTCPASPTTRTTNATFQIGSISAAVSLHPRHCLHTFNVQRHLISRKTLRQFRNQTMGLWQMGRHRLSLSSMPIRGTTVQ